MQNRIKLEIIIGSLHSERIIEILERNEITGYTVIPNVRGRGSEYEADGLGLNNALTNDMIISILEHEVIERIIEPLREVIALCGGIVVVSDCKWLIH